MSDHPPGRVEAPADEEGDAARGARIARWLRDARAGDETARQRLFEAGRSYLAVAAGFHLQSRLRAKVDVSDIVQESLLDAHRGFDRFAGSTAGEWLAWLRRIAARNALDAAKRWRGAAKRDAGREVPLGGADSATGGFEPVAPESSPSGRFLRGEEELRLAEALAALPPPQREVILLRNVERLPFEQVAERMDRSAGACRMLWMRALAALREHLDAGAAEG